MLSEIIATFPVIKQIVGFGQWLWSLIPKRKKTESGLKIPKQTLILLPAQMPHHMHWGFGKHNEQTTMQISGRLQATNISDFSIRAAGIELIRPRHYTVITKIISVENPETGMHSFSGLIKPRTIGEISFTFIIVPVSTRNSGGLLKASFVVIDQFRNCHRLNNVPFLQIGKAYVLPETRWQRLKAYFG